MKDYLTRFGEEKKVFYIYRITLTNSSCHSDKWFIMYGEAYIKILLQCDWKCYYLFTNIILHVLFHNCREK